MTNQRPGCRGFTLLELLIVLGIIATLAGILLPAVQQARAAAFRTECANRLKQVGLALHQHHGIRGSFPPGLNSETGQYPYLSWHARILPFLEQEALWDNAQSAYAQDPTFYHNPPHTGLGTMVRVFTCPADPRSSDTGVWTRLTVAFTDFLGVEGTNLSAQDGVLFVDSQIRLTDITDGSSYTLLAGERPPSPDLAFGWWYAGQGQNFTGSGDMVLGVREVFFGDEPYTCPAGPYHFGVGRLNQQCDTFHFWSLHGDGANFLFADGSVRYLTYAADPILPALATRAGGEPVELP